MSEVLNRPLQDDGVATKARRHKEFFLAEKQKTNPSLFNRVLAGLLKIPFRFTWKKNAKHLLRAFVPLWQN
jgi:hypothetical protein